MIQRYDVDYCTQHACTCEVVKDDEGGYVEYEDYAALEAKYSEAQRELVALRSQVRDASALVKQLHDVVATIGVDVDACEKQEEAWTVWRGGENPVPGKRVDVKYRDGVVASDAFSDCVGWDRALLGYGSDIIAYRVVKEG